MSFVIVFGLVLSQLSIAKSVIQLCCEKMKKKVRFSIQNQYTWVDEIKVQHVLPNKFVQAIGPFVLLEHILSYKQSSNELHEGCRKMFTPVQGDCYLNSTFLVVKLNI